MPFGGPGSNDFKIDHDLIQIYTEMGTHVSINAQKLCCKLLTIAGFLSTPRSTFRKQGKLKARCANKALSSVQTKFILLIGVWRTYHDLMLQDNKTRERDVRDTYWGGIDSTVEDKN